MVEEGYPPGCRWKPNVLVYEVVAMGQQAARRRRRDDVEYELGSLGGEKVV